MSGSFQRTTCRLCESPRVRKVIPFPATPPADDYVSKDRLSQTQPVFPLDLFFCEACGHVQLLSVVDPEILFGNYLYETSTSLGLVEHFRRYAEQVVGRLSPAAGSLVVELGSNDGSLLRAFQARGLRALGVDPARAIARKATESGVETWADYFTAPLAERIRAKIGGAAIVCANNVFAHMDDLSSVVKGVRILLEPRGVFVFEAAYLGDFVEKSLFDTVYHEHLSYHSVGPLQTFLKRHGLILIDVERIPSKAGSIRGFVMRDDAGVPPSAAVEALINHERQMGLDRVETFEALARRLASIRDQVLRTVRDLKARGLAVAGYGASPSTTTLMYFFGLGQSLDFIADDNILKHHRFSPGFHIPVLPSNEIYTRKPAAIFVFAWPYADAIMKKNSRYLDEGGQFILPLPQMSVVKK